MDNTADLLKIKIEIAKRKLPLEAVNAIEAVDWKADILGLRSKYGYTFEQLGDLEIETELVLCGLVRIEDYPKELQDRMKISSSAVNELVNEMNELVFKRIRQELIKNIERKKIFGSREMGDTEKEDTTILNQAGIEIVPDLPEAEQARAPKQEEAKAQTPMMQEEKLELGEAEKPIHPPRSDFSRSTPQEGNKKQDDKMHPLLVRKLSGSFQNPTVKTDHTLNNLSSTTPPNTAPKVDPYREIPE